MPLYDKTLNHKGNYMKKLLAPLCALGFLLSGCGQAAAPAEDGTLHILATTYPVYLFTTAVTEDVEGVEVSLLVNQQTSCLHDYTLTVGDMKAIEGADIIVMNGAGLEDFMDDALSASDAQVIDCSAGIDLLPAQDKTGAPLSIRLVEPPEVLPAQEPEEMPAPDTALQEELIRLIFCMKRQKRARMFMRIL